MTKHRTAQLTMCNLQFLKFEREELRLTCHPLNYKLCRYRMVEWSKMQHKLWAHQHHSLTMLMIEAHFFGSYIRVKTLINERNHSSSPLSLTLKWRCSWMLKCACDVQLRRFSICKLFYTCWCPMSKCQIQFNCQTNEPQKPGHVLLPRDVWKVIPLFFRWSWFNCTSIWECKKGKGEAILQKYFSWAPLGADATLNARKVIRFGANHRWRFRLKINP